MTYIDIVNIVFGALGGALTLLAAHFMIFAIIGIFTKKTFPESEEKLKYALLIPARNEGVVAGKLIESIQKANYPQDKLHIFLIAHNCTDDTAEVGRSLGATVYEYNNEDERTKGYAFRYLLKKIDEDYGIASYDGFFVLDADNIVDEEFFNKMNDAFVAEGKNNLITSYRNSKNFGTNTMSACYGLYFLYGCRLESRGRSVTGCSTRIQGTGYLIPSDILSNGWNYVTLTEDWEFTADILLKDRKIIYCDEAMFYDEQPLKTKVMLRQRLRWSKGHLQVCVTRLKDMIKALFTSKKKGGSKHKFSIFDLCVNISPVCIIAIVFFLLQTVAILLAPAFYPEIGSFVDIMWLHLKGMIRGIVISYSILIFSSVLLYIVERKRIKRVRLWTKIVSSLLFPLFVLISAPLEICSLFMKNLGWKPIPHGDDSHVDALMSGDSTANGEATDGTEDAEAQEEDTEDEKIQA